MAGNLFAGDRKFTSDFFKIHEAASSKSNFAFSKYADGEYFVLKNQRITNCDGWTFDPNEHAEYQKLLMDSFTYQNPGYYKGIPCTCCMSVEDCNWMREHSKQNDEGLTWANIFVNANYSNYQKHMIPLYQKSDVVLVCNEHADISQLPFEVKKDFRVSPRGWIKDYPIVKEVKKYLKRNRLKEHIFLFCAGPLGNILAHQLMKTSNKNVYLDIGSTLDSYMGLGRTRGYLSGSTTLSKKCIWP
tara:strand:- start:263 stop:994 length:732 start_codon:yes stop_codon:yes gene_type:complete